MVSSRYNDKDWETCFELEIRRAEVARSKGNEGRARVCARRAAGIVIKEFLKRKAYPHTSDNVYNLIRLLKNDPSVSEEVQETARRLLMRVSTDFTLPDFVDLIAEAKNLANHLLKSKGP